MSLQVIYRLTLVLLPLLLCRTTGLAGADDAPHGQPDAAASDEPGDQAARRADGSEKSPDISLEGLTRLTPDDEVWIDPRRKIVVVNGRVCLRRGVLELFACPRGSKEHESIVSVQGKAQIIHAALLAVGGLPGKPVQFTPVYEPASGMDIDVWVLWKDADGMNRKVRAQQWIRNIKTDKAMTENWVFAGSGFYVDETTGKKYYQADGSGDLICVSNFSTALLDLPIESSAEAADILFESYTERIPARGTQVRLVLIPRRDPENGQ